MKLGISDFDGCQFTAGMHSVSPELLQLLNF
jgi:hypothetical protein